MTGLGVICGMKFSWKCEQNVHRINITEIEQIKHNKFMLKKRHRVNARNSVWYAATWPTAFLPYAYLLQAVSWDSYYKIYLHSATVAVLAVH